MTTIEIKNLANEFISKVKAELNRQKNSSKRNSYSVDFQCYLNADRNCTFECDVMENNTRFNSYEISILTREIVNLLENLRSTRGWSTLMWDFEEYNFSKSWYSNDYQKIIKSVRLLATPCKEFNSLANYMEKYCGKKLSITDIYCVGIGGKRGRVYGEEGSRYYLAHQPNICSKLLEELRSARGSKDIVTTSAFKQVDDIDKWDLECSIRNEVEFSGSRYNQCEVTIKTPSGKVKKVIRIGV
jgi:hypothetical protein